jgi:threonine synthase
VAPCLQLDDLWILELFHGPTYSLKDIAFQFLGNLFEYFLSSSALDEPTCITILAASAGDCGSAAMNSFRGRQNIQCLILYPNEEAVNIEEEYLTSLQNDNVHCLAVKVRKPWIEPPS